jgi:hypothetical protein
MTIPVPLYLLFLSRTLLVCFIFLISLFCFLILYSKYGDYLKNTEEKIIKENSSNIWEKKKKDEKKMFKIPNPVEVLTTHNKKYFPTHVDINK